MLKSHFPNTDWDPSAHKKLTKARKALYQVLTDIFKDQIYVEYLHPLLVFTRTYFMLCNTNRSRVSSIYARLLHSCSFFGL